MNSQAIYQKLLEHPGDTVIMQVLADALEDEGNTSLSEAYRWAAKHKKWPFQRTSRTITVASRFNDTGRMFEEVTRKVWDWEGEHRDARVLAKVPVTAHLPKKVYTAIRRLNNRVYGDINAAFVLLARTLESVHAAK